MNELVKTEEKQVAKLGRPTTLTPEIVLFVSELLKDGLNALLYTDEDIREEINYELSLEIKPETFRTWIHSNSEFKTLIKKARRQQRENLIKRLTLEKQGWQRFAWLLERKFSEFNLKSISEVTHKIEPIQINLNLAAKTEQADTKSIQVSKETKPLIESKPIAIE